MQDVRRLVKMANQIAENFSFHDDAVERTTDHLRRFWAPSMRSQLAEHAASGGNDLSPTARQAAEGLKSA